LGVSIFLHDPEVTEVEHKIKDDGSDYWVVTMIVGETTVYIFVDDLENFIEPMQCEL